MPSKNQKTKLKRVLAIDWDARTLRVVDAKLTKSKPVIQKIFDSDFPSDLDINDPEQLGKHIRRELDEQGISTKSALVDIPRDQAIFTTLHLTVANPDVLPDMVNIQVAKELPFPASEAAIDFAYPRVESGQTTADVLVASVRKEVLEQYQQTCEHAGLRIERIGLRPYANKVAITENMGDSLPENVWFIDVQPSLMELDLIKKGELVFSRAASISIPSHVGNAPSLSVVNDADDFSSDSDDESGSLRISNETSNDEPGENIPRPFSTSGSSSEVLNMLTMEAARTFEAYRTTDVTMETDLVVVGGDVGIEEEFQRTLENKLGIKAILYNPADSLEWDHVDGQAAIAHASTIGLVLGQAQDDRHHFDFLHPKESVSKTKERLRMLPKTIAAVLVFVGGISFLVYNTFADELKQLDSYKQSIKESEKEIRDTKSFMRIHKAVSEFDNESIVWLDNLVELKEVLPDNKQLIITEITGDQDDGEILFKTRTKSRAIYHEAVESINNIVHEYKKGKKTKEFNPYFAEVKKTGKPDTGEEFPFRQDIEITLQDKNGKPLAGKRRKRR